MNLENLQEPERKCSSTYKALIMEIRGQSIEVMESKTRP